MRNDVVALAMTIAKEAHKGQTRKYGHAHIPYIFHPMRVSARVALWDVNSEDMIAAAMLHDVPEDTWMKEEDLRARGIPWAVAALVAELTNPSKEMQGASRARKKAADRRHLAKVSREAKIIKLVDRIDNVREALDDRETPQDWLKIYLMESEKLFAVLRGVDAELEAELAAELERGKKLLCV